MKLFNNHTYVILSIKNDEAKELLDIAQKSNLGLMYPKLFKKGYSEIARLCINDERLGGILSGMICWYEMSLLKNKEYRTFNNIQELKKYIEKANQRKELNILNIDINLVVIYE